MKGNQSTTRPEQRCSKEDFFGLLFFSRGGHGVRGSTLTTPRQTNTQGACFLLSVERHPFPPHTHSPFPPDPHHTTLPPGPHSNLPTKPRKILAGSNVLSYINHFCCPFLWYFKQNKAKQSKSKAKQTCSSVDTAIPPLPPLPPFLSPLSPHPTPRSPPRRRSARPSPPCLSWPSSRPCAR